MVPHSSSWVVNSRATFHATSNMRFFNTYKSGNFVVKMGFPRKCKVVGIGDLSVVTNMGHKLVLKKCKTCFKFEVEFDVC